MVATRDNLDHPTWLFFVLDPVAGVSFDRVLEVAGWIEERLEALGLPKTNGGDGLHTFVPLVPSYTFEEVRAWLRAFIAALSRRYPGAITSDKQLAARHGRVLIDYAQNVQGKSIVAPYSVRAKPHAPVSTPLRWVEVHVRQVRPTDFTLRTVPERVRQMGTPLARWDQHSQC